MIIHTGQGLLEDRTCGEMLHNSSLQHKTLLSILHSDHERYTVQNTAHRIWYFTLIILHSERHIIVLWLLYKHRQCILWSLVSDLYFSGRYRSLNVWLCLRLLMSW